MNSRRGRVHAAIGPLLACAALAGTLLASWHPAHADAAAPASAPASGSAGEVISAAEQWLFMHPHMATTPGPRTLAYSYAAQATAGPEATDKATLALLRRGDGSCCTLHGDYLTGPMAVHLPDLDAASSNPILLYFLEGEVRLMERTTHGQSAHFRRQIRQSLATSATVGDTTVSWNGGAVRAHVIHVAPFLDDPFRSRFEREAKTEYAFVLSDDVPGGVVAMSATLPGASAADPPLARRSLTLDDPTPAKPAQP
jgi:hypothetical protein